MILTALITLILFSQDEVPYKAKEDFEIKFELEFKQRIHTDAGRTVHLDESRSDYEKRTSATVLPYLKLSVKILNVNASEAKLKVTMDDHELVYSKKVTAGMEFKLEPGFTDDVKDRVSGYKHVIQFYSSDKKVVSRIVIEFDEDGNYFVNGEKRGKV